MSEKWTNERICQFYDRNPHITLQYLSQITGKTVAELKKILMA